jgi:putative PIN family toxin of toxin-antitoxin system
MARSERGKQARPRPTSSVPSRSSAAAGSVPRVVADTNVYISALNFSGAADEVLALGRAGAIQLFVSPPILGEIEGVLLRKFGWAAARVREAAKAIRGFAVLVNPSEMVSVVHEDESDNRILECAIASGADTIVTGDRHLLKLGRFRDIVIVSPREFLDAK